MGVSFQIKNNIFDKMNYISSWEITISRRNISRTTFNNYNITTIKWSRPLSSYLFYLVEVQLVLGEYSYRQKEHHKTSSHCETCNAYKRYWGSPVFALYITAQERDVFIYCLLLRWRLDWNIKSLYLLCLVLRSVVQSISTQNTKDIKRKNIKGTADWSFQSK